MMSSFTLITMRLVHVTAATFWVGAALFISVFLMPTLAAIGPAAGPVMEQLSRVRRMPVYMMAAATLTILSGAVLMWGDSYGFQAAWVHSGPGMTFSLGAALGIAGAIVGMAVNSPAARRMGELATTLKARGGPPTAAELATMQGLQRRLGLGGHIVAALIVLATCAMAVARYVP